MTSNFPIDCTKIPYGPNSAEHLYSLQKAGFKIVALTDNHNPDPEWTPIYDNPNYWQDKSFEDPKICSRFKNVATTLGKTHLKDFEKHDLYLQALDIDSECAFNLINTPISQLCKDNAELKSWIERFFDSSNISQKEYWNFTLLGLLKQLTFVTKTRKPHGYHIWWLSRSQNRSIRTTHCQKDREFEIKTDKSSALCTLPPSTHRDDPNFRYTFIGRTDKMLVNDGLYDLFICLLKECLLQKQGRIDYKIKNIKNSFDERPATSFFDINEDTIKKSAELLSPYYKQPNRNNFTLPFSGYAYYCGVSEDSTCKIILEICDLKEDKDIKERLTTLHGTYHKASKGEAVTGGPTLADLMSKVKNCSINEAQEILDHIKDLWYKDMHTNDDDDNSNENDDDLSKNTILSVSQAKMYHRGRIKVRGKIMQCSASFKMILSSNNSCLNKECNFEYQKRFPRPLLLTNDKAIDNKCPKCSKSIISTTIDHTNAVELELQDVDNVNDIDRLLVYLFEDNIKSLKIGESVVIGGNIDVVNKNDNRRKKLIAALYGNTIKYEHDKKIELTQNDIEEIIRLKNEKENIDTQGIVKSDWIDFLVSQFAPQIARNYYPKLGILLAAVNSGPDEVFKKRDRTHVLLVGEPGLAKTKLLEDAVELVPNSKYMSMSNTSGISLTAMIEKDEGGGGYSVRAGSIVLAKNAIFAANEIGDLDFKNQLYLGDIMEEGVTHISKYTIDAQLVAPVTMISACNPTGTYWKYPDRIDQTEIPLPLKEIDRYDLQFFLRMPRNGVELESFASEIVQCDKKYPLSIDYTFLKKVILYAKQFKPKISEEAISEIQKYWVRVAASQRGSVRIKKVLERISKAIAKFHFRNVVYLEDTVKAIQIYKYIISQYETFDQSHTIPKNPQYIAADVCADILMENPSVDKRMDDLIEIACSKNPQVDVYFTGEKKIKTSYKARSVKDILLQNPNIKKVGINPITLQWFERPPPSQQQQSENSGSMSSYLSTSQPFLPSSNDVQISSKSTNEKNVGDKEHNTVLKTKHEDIAHRVEDTEGDEGDESNVCNVEKMDQNVTANSTNCIEKDGSKIDKTGVQTVSQKIDNPMEPKNMIEYPTDKSSIVTTAITTATLHSSPSLHTTQGSDNVITIDSNNNIQNRRLVLRHTNEADIQTNDSLETESVEQNSEELVI